MLYNQEYSTVDRRANLSRKKFLTNMLNPAFRLSLRMPHHNGKAWEKLLKSFFNQVMAISSKKLSAKNIPSMSLSN